jgi:hypothetical protein
MRRLRIVAGILGLALASTGTGAQPASAQRAAGGPASFCSDVQALSVGFTDLETAGSHVNTVKHLIREYKKLEREAPASIKSSVRAIRQLAQKLWTARPSNAEEAARVMTPPAVRKLTTASRKLGKYLQEHCT